jgi:hypothetical protein
MGEDGRGGTGRRRWKYSRRGGVGKKGRGGVEMRNMGRIGVREEKKYFSLTR